MVRRLHRQRHRLWRKPLVNQRSVGGHERQGLEKQTKACGHQGRQGHLAAPNRRMVNGLRLGFRNSLRGILLPYWSAGGQVEVPEM